MPNSNEKQRFLDEYSQFPEVLRLALDDVSRHGFNSTYDRFKNTYAPHLFGLEQHPQVREYDDVGERRYSQAVLASYSLGGILLAAISRPQMDLENRERDFLVVTADLEERKITEWEIHKAEVSKDRHGLTHQVLDLQSDDWREGAVALDLTSNGCTIDGHELYPLTDLENKLRNMHRRYGHQAVQGYLLSEETESATVAA